MRPEVWLICLEVGGLDLQDLKKTLRRFSRRSNRAPEPQSEGHRSNWAFPETVFNAFWETLESDTSDLHWCRNCPKTISGTGRIFVKHGWACWMKIQNWKIWFSGRTNRCLR